MATFSLICHGDQPNIDEMFPVLAEALRSVGPDKAILYYDSVLAGLPAPARLRWEAFMTSVADKYQSELFREIATRGFAEGEAEGKAKGEAQAVLTVLEARGIPVTAGIKDQILACTDLAKLDTWLRRALTASSAFEVVQS